MQLIWIKLLLAHFLGDFVFQPNSWVKQKRKYKLRAPQFYLHILIHGVLAGLLSWDPILALLIAGSHAIIDLIKMYFQKKKNSSLWFIVDQLLHLSALFALWVYWYEVDLDYSSFFASRTLWIYITAIVFLTQVCAIFMRVLLSGWARQLEEKEDDSLISAGKYIGILERLFVFAFVVMNQWSAIGFLIAAKSVFRFGDISQPKNRKFTEYILIGTLLSFGIAALTGLWVRTI